MILLIGNPAVASGPRGRLALALAGATLLLSNLAAAQSPAAQATAPIVVEGTVVPGAQSSAPTTTSLASPTPGGLAAVAETAAARGSTVTPEASAPGASGSQSAEVRLHDRGVFVLRRGVGELDVSARAAQASQALATAFKSPHAEVRLQADGEAAVVYVGDVPIVRLEPADAHAVGGAALGPYAEGIAAQLRAAVAEEQHRSAIAQVVFNLSLVVTLGLVALYLLKLAGRIALQWSTWLREHPHRVTGLRLKSFEVVGAPTVRVGASFAVGAGLWVARLALVYAWLVFTSSLFESTRGVAERLTGMVLAPLVQFLQRVVASLPTVLIGLLALVVMGLVLRATRLLFASVASGETRLSWLVPEHAVVVGVLIRVAIVLFTLLVLAPLVLGGERDLLGRIGLILLGALALGSVPLLANAAIGVVLLLQRHVRPGDEVQVGEARGKVLMIDWLATELLESDGAVVRVPHLYGMLRPMHRRRPAQVKGGT